MKIISAHRYKKTTRKQVENKKKNNKIKYSTKKNKCDNLKYKKEKLNRIKLSKKKSKDKFNDNENISACKMKKKNRVYIPNIFKIVAVVLVIFLIGVVSKKIVDFENMPVLNVFSNKDNKNLEKDYDMSIGITKLDTTDVLKTKNIVLNELSSHTTQKLLSINSDYTINFIAAENVEKVSNREYLIYLDKSYDVTFDILKISIEKIKESPENIYYNNVNKLKEIVKEKEFVRLILNEDDPYYIYKLDFPIFYEDNSLEYKITNTTSDTVNFLRNKSSLPLRNISLKGYGDSDQMVADFRDNKIDMFFTSSDDAMQMIGRHEYNIKKYRDGENIFLLGNKNSELYSLKEVRKALAYSLRREEIIKQVNNSFSELIDIPFIYSEIKYKYDIYGAENELLSNGWKKVNGVYFKKINENERNLELNLLVNEEDSTKRKIADIIKEMSQNVGIKINVNIVNKTEFEQKLNNKEYDIILADVYTNQYPDIEYLKEYVNINDVTNTAFENVYKSENVTKLQENIKTLQDTISSEIGCIGIYAKNTNLVYQKYITGFEYTNYFRLFDNLQSVGKIKQE